MLTLVHVAVIANLIPGLALAQDTTLPELAEFRIDTPVVVVTSGGAWA
jgi:hypothetical protein